MRYYLADIGYYSDDTGNMYSVDTVTFITERDDLDAHHEIVRDRCDPVGNSTAKWSDEEQCYTNASGDRYYLGLRTEIDKHTYELIKGHITNESKFNIL